MRLNLPGFGEVYCYADNDGRGYSNTATVEFVVEAAKTRLQRARAVSEVARKAGVPREPAVESHWCKQQPHYRKKPVQNK